MIQGGLESLAGNNREVHAINRHTHGIMQPHKHTDTFNHARSHIHRKQMKIYQAIALIRALDKMGVEDPLPR